MPGFFVYKHITIHNHITDPSCNRVKVYGHIDCSYHPQGWCGGNRVPFIIALIFGEGTADSTFKIRPLPFRHPASEGKAKMKPADKNKTSSWSERRETANTSWETPDDRRHKMQEYLSAKRKVTYRELATEYGITRRTAMRDIEILTLSVPLETVPGNGGGVKVMDVDVLQLARATSVAQGFDQTLRHIRHRADVDMVARLDDFDGFLSRDCLILFLHFSRTYVS